MQTDSSRSGLGAKLLQNCQPIAYASKSLTASQKNYAMIELECLGILFGLKRYHQWVYGRKVTVETDHLPLVAIFKKPLHAVPAMLQRMLLHMQPYDIEVKHRPGKDIPVPDTLSRKPLPETGPDLSDQTDIQVNMVMSSSPVHSKKMQEIKTETHRDETLSVLKQVIQSRWPDSKRLCPSQIIESWNYRDKLTVVDGIVMKGCKLVIPRVLRPRMLEIVHAGHMGVEKCLRRARYIMCWPHISAEISQ